MSTIGTGIHGVVSIKVIARGRVFGGKDPDNKVETTDIVIESDKLRDRRGDPATITFTLFHDGPLAVELNKEE